MVSDEYRSQVVIAAILQPKNLYILHFRPKQHWHIIHPLRVFNNCCSFAQSFFFSSIDGYTVLCPLIVFRFFHDFVSFLPKSFYFVASASFYILLKEICKFSLMIGLQIIRYKRYSSQDIRHVIYLSFNCFFVSLFLFLSLKKGWL